MRFVLYIFYFLLFVYSLLFMFYVNQFLLINKSNNLSVFFIDISKFLEYIIILFNRTDWSPLTRHTIWALTIGGFVHWLQISAINQNMIQRYLSLPTIQSARRYILLFHKFQKINIFFYKNNNMFIFNLYNYISI